MSCPVCFARRYLVAFHYVKLSWEYLQQVPYQSLCIMESLCMTTTTFTQHHTRVISFSLHRHLRLQTTHFRLHRLRSLARQIRGS